MHVGFEPSPVLGAKRKFGDTWKMLKWQFSAATWAAMAAHGRIRSKAWRFRDTAWYAHATASAEDLVSSDGRLRVL